MPAGRPVSQPQDVVDSIAAMRVVQGSGVLMESGIAARAADAAFLDSALELYPEDQNPDLTSAQNGAQPVHNGCLGQQRNRLSGNAPCTNANQAINEKEEQAGRQSVALNGNPATNEL